MKTKPLDLQNETPLNHLAIDKVGVKNIEYPISVMDKENKVQPTIAHISMFVGLPHVSRGAHMSRFINLIDQNRGLITQQRLKSILQQIKSDLQALSSHLEIRFPYFIERLAPVSNKKSLMGYRCGFFAKLDEKDIFNQYFEVKVPVLNLCPCSKEISEYGAHNQRSIVTVNICSRKMIWLEDIIKMVEDSASSPLYPLLKREDEKYITEQSYEKPRFVEDVVREIAARLNSLPRLEWYDVESENMESIHNHNVYAKISKKF